MISHLTRASECGSCQSSSSCVDQAGCISCSNPDPHMKMHPLGVHTGHAAYPSSFDPTWKLVKCSNFSLRLASAAPVVVAPLDVPSLDDGVPFQNSASWRRRGFKTIFRHSKIYLYQPTTGATYVTQVAGGDWMLHTDVHASPWRDATTEVRGTSLEMEFRTTSLVCYCDNGVSSCDFCAGRRPVGDPLPMPAARTRSVATA